MTDLLEPEGPGVDNDRVLRLTQRSHAITTASVSMIAVIIAVAVVLISGVASSAQRDVNSQRIENARLRTELECRSVIASDHAIAQADIAVLTSRGLILVVTGGNTDAIVGELGDATVRLEEASDARRMSVETCKQAGDDG